MIEFFKNWVEQLAIAIVIVSIIELLLPSGNLKKYIKIVLGIYIVFCIVNPFVNGNSILNFENSDFENYIENQSVSNINEESMNKRIQDLYIQELKKTIENNLAKRGYKIYKCEIDADLSYQSAKPRNTQNKLNN